jgi:hypothetical protein
MIHTALYVMLLIRANPLRGYVVGGWALEIETFLGPVKRHRAIRRVPTKVDYTCVVVNKTISAELFNLYLLCPSRWAAGQVRGGGGANQLF